MDDPIDLVEVQRQLDRRRAELEAAEGKLQRDSSQAIGPLAQRIASSPERMASTLTANLPASAPGLPTPVARPSSAISRHSGANAASVRQAVLALDSDRAGSLLQALLRPLEQLSLQPVLSEDFEVTGYRLTGPIQPRTLAEMKRLVEQMTKCSGKELVARELLKCLTLTKSRERDGADVTLMIAAMADRLAEFPPDVVATALRKWADRETWWPSLAELREPCLREMRWRRSLKIALEEAETIPQSGGGDAA